MVSFTDEKGSVDRKMSGWRKVTYRGPLGGRRTVIVRRPMSPARAGLLVLIGLALLMVAAQLV